MTSSQRSEQNRAAVPEALRRCQRGFIHALPDASRQELRTAVGDLLTDALENIEQDIALGSRVFARRPGTLPDTRDIEDEWQAFWAGLGNQATLHCSVPAWLDAAVALECDLPLLPVMLQLTTFRTGDREQWLANALALHGLLQGAIEGLDHDRAIPPVTIPAWAERVDAFQTYALERPLPLRSIDLVGEAADLAKLAAAAIAAAPARKHAAKVRADARVKAKEGRDALIEANLPQQAWSHTSRNPLTALGSLTVGALSRMEKKQHARRLRLYAARATQGSTALVAVTDALSTEVAGLEAVR